MIYKAHNKQAQFHKDNHRIRGAFAGKRCITPDTSVLTKDGIKAFGDIQRGDFLVSFDSKENRYRLSQSSDSFPKTKEIGYRVIHERGEFVVSASHRVFCSDHVYRSVQEILYESFDRACLLSPDRSNEELFQSMLPSDARRLKKTPEDYLDDYEFCTHRYGQSPRLAIIGGQSLSPQIPDAQGFLRSGVCRVSCALRACLSNKILKHNHPDPILYRRKMKDASHRENDHPEIGVVDRPYVNTHGQTHRCNQEFLQRRDMFSASYKEEQPGQDPQKVFSLASRILAIEAESRERWFWDVEVPGDNNYLAGGAIHHNSGKTECGAIESIIFSEGKIGFKDNGVDRYTGVIIAPTTDMLRRLSFEKFLSYSKPFKPMIHKSFNEIYWHNGAIIYGISGEHPARLEGIKANWIWMDEGFQLKEQIFLEALARISDTQGRIWVTGSLGTQYTNPKAHWVYKHFIQKPLADSAYFQWATLDNPYFPREEIDRLKETLDPKTFRQMFELSWDVQSSYQVYDDFDDSNIIKGYQYDPRLETSVSIDWGWAHSMACLFFQYDQKTDRVYCFDEIVGSKITLEQLWDRIKAKGYYINNWYCDIAGTQEREQTGKSNVRWFADAPRNIHFKYRSSAINYGIPIIRSYIKNGLGQRRLFIDETRCTHLIDGLRNYAYPEKNGVIQNENPIKKDDDCCDALRYMFVNRLDYSRNKDELANLDRWRLDSWR